MKSVYRQAMRLKSTPSSRRETRLRAHAACAFRLKSTPSSRRETRMCAIAACTFVLKSTPSSRRETSSSLLKIQHNSA